MTHWRSGGPLGDVMSGAGWIRSSKAKPADEERYVAGFDGSRGREFGVADATGIVVCRVSDAHLMLAGVWQEPPGPAGRDWTVPREEVAAAVDTLFDRLNLVGFYCDPAGWEQEVSAWEGNYGERLLVRARSREPMKWWCNGYQIVEAVEQFHDSALRGELTIDGHPVLVRHLENARRRPNKWGTTIAKEGKSSARKIDLAIAAVLAWRCRRDALTLPPQKKRSGRVW